MFDINVMSAGLGAANAQTYAGNLAAHLLSKWASRHWSYLK